MQRIGVFICQCGPTLEDAIDFSALAHAAAQLQNVVHVETVSLLCTPDASAALAETIHVQAIDRVVFAACSPREHEATFRKILTDAGLNPYMMQIASIREHCAWVIHDRKQASAKAISLIRGAAERVRHHERLYATQIEARADVLVIGAGVAGISAARTLAQKDRRVFLLERSACIGGKVALYEDLYPELNCAACLIEPDLDTVLHDDQIELITLADVESLRGGPGNFIASIRQAPRGVDRHRCIGCGACTDACPVMVPNPINAFMDQCAAIRIPYPGALPHVATIDHPHCLRGQGEPCTRCRDACPFDAIDYYQSETRKDLSIGAVIVATGFQCFAPGRDDRYRIGAPDDVITAAAFERMVNTNGPTGGRIITARGQPPQQVAFVHCVGSRTDEFNAYCSGICCLTSIKHAQQVKRQLPDSQVHHIYADLCLPGRSGQPFFDRHRTAPGVVLHRMQRPGAVRIIHENDTPVVVVAGPGGNEKRIEADLVVLATALEPPRDARQMAEQLDIDLDPDGFFRTHHPVTAPVQSSREGIYLAGCCQGPTDIPTSVAQGQAAAGAILQHLLPGGKMTLDPIVARVDTEMCSGCRTCADICPFGAITRDADESTVDIEKSLCRGCGICAAACPSAAITLNHFSRNAVYAEITGLLNAPDD